MTFYEYLEEAAKEKGYKDITDFCIKADISAYLQQRFKYNSSLRADTKEKIAKALKTNQGFVNQLVAQAQRDKLMEAVKNTKTESVDKEVEEPQKKKSDTKAQYTLDAKKTSLKKRYKEVIHIPSDPEEGGYMDEVVAPVAEDISVTVEEEPVIEQVEESADEQADEKVVEEIECQEEVKVMDEKVETVGSEQVAENSIAEQFKESWLKMDKAENKDDVKKQERNAANLEFVYSNINVYREVKDAFYLRQAQVYLSKMIEDAD